MKEMTLEEHRQLPILAIRLGRQLDAFRVFLDIDGLTRRFQLISRDRIIYQSRSGS